MGEGETPKEEYRSERLGDREQHRWRAMRAYLSDKPELAAQLWREGGMTVEVLVTGLLDFADQDWYPRFFAALIKRA